jgi:hypothetical protein
MPHCTDRLNSASIEPTLPMSQLDSHEEKTRLAKHYAALSDEEIYELLRDAYSLTEIAWEALDEEADRRGLDEDRPDLRVADVRSEFAPLVHLCTFRDLPDALLAKGKLESNGIDSYLADENVVRMDWFWSNAVGGIKLQVREEDFRAAASILAEPAPAPSAWHEEAEE